MELVHDARVGKGTSFPSVIDSLSLLEGVSFLCSSTLPYAFIALFLTKHRDNFTFAGLRVENYTIARPPS
jgi:hypothetical protein